VDLNKLLHRHQLSLMKADASLAPAEQRAHHQFASDYASEIRRRRDLLGAKPSLPGSVT
jgi:hypothetical protein